MHPTAVVSVVLKHMSLFLFHLGGILQLIFGKSVTASFLLFDLYSLLFWFIAFFFPYIPSLWSFISCMYTHYSPFGTIFFSPVMPFYFPEISVFQGDVQLCFVLFNAG